MSDRTETNREALGPLLPTLALVANAALTMLLAHLASAVPWLAFRYTQVQAVGPSYLAHELLFHWFPRSALLVALGPAILLWFVARRAPHRLLALAFLQTLLLVLLAVVVLLYAAYLFDMPPPKVG